MTSNRKFGQQVGRGLMLAWLGLLGCNGEGCQGCGDRAFAVRDAGPEDGSNADGNVSVKGGFNNCPIVSLTAAPVMVRVGQSVALTGQASDIDPGDSNLSFKWTTSSGFFQDDEAPRTTYFCTRAGSIDIKLTVSDGKCPTVATVAVFCVALRDGGADASGGTTGSTGAGGSTGSGGSGAGGGAGGSMGPNNSCPAAEPGSGEAMCATCTMENCSLGAMGTEGCCGLANPADQLLCQAAYTCFVSKACTKSGDPTDCFCGTNLGTCFALFGAANGPCVKEVQAAAKTEDPMEIQRYFQSPNFPIGRAVNLATCRGGLCPSECAIR
jgi:hypothetical protein